MVPLEKLKLLNFRNYTEKEFDFSEQKIVLTGSNGSGKTNVLESIYFLSILRSFRTVKNKEMIRSGSGGFQVEGLIHNGKFRKHLKVCQKNSLERKLWVDDLPIHKSSEFIREFRTVAFVPEDQLTVKNSASFRRRFFDMLISKMDVGYMKRLSDYQRALSQRNRALKEHQRPEIFTAFDPLLAENIGGIVEKRLEYSRQIESEVNELLRSIGKSHFEVVYRYNYMLNASEYLEMLEKCRERDQIRGMTGIGPQLDDFELYWDGKLLRYYGSTGQIRIISILLKLAEFRIIRRCFDEKLLVLVDDVTGELDRMNREFFFSCIEEAEQQFFTYTQFPDFFDERKYKEIKI